jgi:hypothetical protein
VTPALRRHFSLFPDILVDHFRVAEDSFRMQNWMLTRCFKTRIKSNGEYEQTVK